MGVIGLSLGIDFVEALGLATLHDREMGLLARLRDALPRSPRSRSTARATWLGTCPS